MSAYFVRQRVSHVGAADKCALSRQRAVDAAGQSHIAVPQYVLPASASHLAPSNDSPAQYDSTVYYSTAAYVRVERL